MTVSKVYIIVFANWTKDLLYRRRSEIDVEKISLFYNFTEKSFVRNDDIKNFFVGQESDANRCLYDALSAFMDIFPEFLNRLPYENFIEIRAVYIAES